MSDQVSAKEQFYNSVIAPILDPVYKFLGQFYIAPYTVVAVPVLILTVILYLTNRKNKSLKVINLVVTSMAFVIVGTITVLKQYEFVANKLGNH